MNIGIIGGGLMGRETASALARWFTLAEDSLRVLDAKLIAVADTHEPTLDWYRRVPTARLLTADYHGLLDDPDVEVVYVAVPHNLHEQIYLDVLESGKDLLGEKPFGIDLSACERICDRVRTTGRFVRCSSEFPFYPVVQRAFDYLQQTDIGIPIRARSSFLHSSDIDPNKPINWKRQVATCGQIGVMGDLGLHVCHLPFRLGLKPDGVYADLQKIYPSRPDGKGGTAVCDTWDNARLSARAGSLPITFETFRIAPGEMNSWEFELVGTKGGVRVSTKNPKAFWTFEVEGGAQEWRLCEVGSKTAFKTITGEIFEFGFADAILQMWAAFAAERGGLLNGRFGCATPEEALLSHRLFNAALRSHEAKAYVEL